jgi:sugar phosphate isomerase/epimerase
MPCPISIQLYSLRREARHDFADVIRRLGEIGYVGVEPAGLHDLTPAEFRRQVEDAGMVMSAAHVALPTRETVDAILDEQEAIGNRDLVVAFLPEDRFADADAVQRVADDLNQANEWVSGRGMRLGYHNHWWEYQVRLGGRTAHEHLFDQLDDGVFAEVDTYWARVGGVDPVTAVERLGTRARMLHLKDGPGEDTEALNTAVGEGALDMPAISAASHAEWHVVELDRCAGDMFEAVEKSHRYLVGAGLASGRP